MSEYALISGLTFNGNPAYYLPLGVNLLSSTSLAVGPNVVLFGGATLVGNVLTFAAVRSGVMMTNLGLTVGSVYTFSFTDTGNAVFCLNYWDGNSGDNYSPNFTATSTAKTNSFTFVAPANPGALASLAFVNHNPTTAGSVTLTNLKLEAGSVAT